LSKNELDRRNSVNGIRSRNEFILQRVDFPYTHNLGHLLGLCAAHAPWPDKLRDAEEPTPFAVTARCPGEDEEATRVQAVGSIDIAERIRRAVRDATRTMGLSLPSEPTL